MRRMQRTGWILCLSFGFAVATANAEVKVEQKSQMKFGGAMGRMMNVFGGKAAKEGVTSAVAVKGDRKATTSENRMQIVDLAEEKVYDVDLNDRSYKVTTFEQMRQELQKQREKAEKNSERVREQQPQREMEMDFDVKETGQKKTINGFNCRQFITTITMHEKGKTLEQAGGMVLTTDSWLTPELNAEKEIADFDLRYARKLQSQAVGDMAQQMAQAMAMYPGMEQAMTKMRAEKVNMKGSAVLTTMTFDTVPSKEQLAQQSQEKEEGGGGGLLGGFAKRLGRKKSDDQQQSASGGRSTFMTATTELLSLSTTVGAADLAVPEGFKLKK